MESIYDYIVTSVMNLIFSTKVTRQLISSLAQANEYMSPAVSDDDESEKIEENKLKSNGNETKITKISKMEN